MIEGGEPAMDGTILGFTDLNCNGLSDSVEARPLPLPNTDGTDGPDFLDLDADGDGLPDAAEGFDADHDGAPDFGPAGTDTDGDGIDDAFDLDCVTPPTAVAWWGRAPRCPISMETEIPITKTSTTTTGWTRRSRSRTRPRTPAPRRIQRT